MRPQDYIDHENSKARIGWIKRNMPALAICFAATVGVDQTCNAINKGLSFVSGMPANATPYTTQLAKTGWHKIQNTLGSP